MNRRAFLLGFTALVVAPPPPPPATKVSIESMRDSFVTYWLNVGTLRPAAYHRELLFHINERAASFVGFEHG